MATTGSKNLSLRADALRNRERLVEVARLELAAGNVSLQLNDIARKAGVGVGTAYRHFPTPQALLEAVVGHELGQLVAVAKQALEIADPRKALVFTLNRALELQLGTDGGLGAVMKAIEDSDLETTRAKDELTRLIDELIRRAHRAKVVRRDITAEDVRNLMCGLEYAIRMPGAPDPGRVERYLAVLIDGLGPPQR
jgi:AcrR family transcriptional regulator